MIIATVISTVIALPSPVNATETNSKLLASQINSTTNGLSDCYHAIFVNRERQILAKCNAFRSIADRKNGRQFSFDFPAGSITFYTDFNSPPGKYQDGVVWKGQRTRSYYINRIVLNDKNVNIQDTLRSSDSRIRCYVTDDYVEAACDLPNKSYVQYKK
ncbi:hypothetical protein H6G41_27135 [Tolypothrix sp. FACHB-123]|uniref:hypothetical protein n=1 Tax=Tolypothrix sp. FACHB-123 TaxID=2692868 RepID=UPI001688414D|nr:hypothetical protein [Tolypothrix sp. FACHB-123]MBD2358243.1 hypothetical protein [Tolypothrix sp. FACHB-123]